MTLAVVDTNVILVANNAHAEASPECVLECVKRLQTLMATGTVAIDDAYRILSEYQNKTSPRKGKGVGDLFVKWVLSKQADTKRIHQVELTEVKEHAFLEFPDADLEIKFDPPDRKFVAVAHAHPNKPPVWQAVDSKWLDWWPALKKHGVEVDFLCKEDACRYYKKKFPRKPAPQFP